MPCKLSIVGVAELTRRGPAQFQLSLHSYSHVSECNRIAVRGAAQLHVIDHKPEPVP
jgi:D-hexose-6-phosphate mutarotase